MLKIVALIATALTGCFASCSSVDNTKSQNPVKEFEGVITYHEVMVSRMGVLSDTITLFYSHGNYVSIHSNGICVKDYYLCDKPLRLYLYKNSDTLHQLSLNSNEQKLQSFELNNGREEILSKRCESIDIKNEFDEKDSVTYTYSRLFFSRGFLNVDKSHFKNWNLGFFNKFIDKSGAFALRSSTVHFGKSHTYIIIFKES